MAKSERQQLKSTFENGINNIDKGKGQILSVMKRLEEVVPELSGSAKLISDAIEELKQSIISLVIDKI